MTLLIHMALYKEQNKDRIPSLKSLLSKIQHRETKDRGEWVTGKGKSEKICSKVSTGPSSDQTRPRLPKASWKRQDLMDVTLHGFPDMFTG